MSNFWRERGDHGLKWLVSRLRPEGQIDLLDGVASILARIGDTAIPPFLTSWSSAVTFKSKAQKEMTAVTAIWGSRRVRALFQRVNRSGGFYNLG